MAKEWLCETLKSQTVLSDWKERPRVLCERISKNPKVDFRGREDFSWDPLLNLKAAEWK